MAVDNPFEITYGSRAVGGASDTYQLHGPYVIDKTFESIRVVFDVVVVATTYATVRSLSDALEDDFRKRDQSLIIELDKIANSGVSLWTYTFGSHASNDGILNSKATISKTGDSETDRGFSRAYTCVIEGDLPADDAATGLRDVQWNVDYEAGRQRIVSMVGSYTALGGTGATAKYQNAAGADAEASTFLGALLNYSQSTGAGTFELVEENFTPDRNDHIVTFERQYVELLANQSQASLDDTSIRAHTIVFTEVANHPGDGQAEISRLRRVVGNYDCNIDIDQTTDLQTTFTTTVRPHIIALFETNFTPSVFAIEDERMGYDETAKRMSVALTIIYQASGGTDIIEVQQAVGIRESRTLDRTPVHTKSGLAAYVDPGWDTAERISTRSITAIGTLFANGRLGSVSRSGWNVIANTSQVEQRFIGDATSNEQIQISTLTETVVESFNKSPSGGGGSNYEPGSTRAPRWLKGGA